MKVGEEDLFRVVVGGVNRVFPRECVGRGHSSAQGVITDQIVVLKEHLPASLLVGQALQLFKVG